jgi:ectoine hydroxylase-related dioxygenase (phytanoyl-CoA dioxygenase family)
MHVTPADLAKALEAYDRDGYAVLGRVVTDETLEALRARIDAIMMGEIVHEGLFFQLDGTTGRYEDTPRGLGWQGPSRAYRKIEKLERDPVFRAYLEDPFFERLCRARIEGEVALYRAIVMGKSARVDSEGGGSDLPWHQDGGTFWGLDRDPDLQVWTALDDAPIEAGCLEFVPGTHHAGLATKLGGVIPDDVAARERAEERRVLVPARAGEVVLIHNHVWHRSARNRTALPRRAFSVCYMPATTRCMRKKRAPRSFVKLFQGAGVLPAPEGEPGSP